MGIFSKSRRPRTACRCHHIQSSKHQCNITARQNYPAVVISTTPLDMPVTLRSRRKQEHGHLSSSPLASPTTFVIGLSEQTLCSFQEICFARFPFFFLDSFPCLFCLSIVWRRGRPGEINVEGRGLNQLWIFCSQTGLPFQYVNSNHHHTAFYLDSAEGMGRCIKNGWLLLGRDFLISFLWLHRLSFHCARWSLHHGMANWARRGGPGVMRGWCFAGRNIRLAYRSFLLEAGAFS